MTEPAQLTIRPHPRAFGVWYLAMVVLGLGPLNNPEALMSPVQGLIAAALIGLGILVKAKTSLLIVDAEKISRRGGLFNRQPIDKPTRELEEAAVLAGLIHRLLNVGVLSLHFKNDDQPIRFWGVAEPNRVKAAIEQLAGLAPARPDRESAGTE